MPCIKIPNGILTVSGKYEVGSQPPSGFMEWYEWAETQHKAGLRQVECHACGKWRYPQEIERLREANAEMQKQIARAWNDGFDFAMKGCGWQEGEDPSTEGLYVVRDSKGNIEVGMWYAKTTNGQPAEWSKEFRDVDRDNIVAWMMVPPNAEVSGAGTASAGLPGYAGDNKGE